jgi:hypothetical protein
VNSYLWISGAIQPDTTRRRTRKRPIIVALIAVLAIGALIATIVRAGSATGVGHAGSRASARNVSG